MQIIIIKLDKKSGEYLISSPYNAELVEAIKEVEWKYREWDKPYWKITPHSYKDAPVEEYLHSICESFAKEMGAEFINYSRFTEEDLIDIKVNRIRELKRIAKDCPDNQLHAEYNGQFLKIKTTPFGDIFKRLNKIQDPDLLERKENRSRSGCFIFEADDRIIKMIMQYPSFSNQLRELEIISKVGSLSPENFEMVVVQEKTGTDYLAKRPDSDLINYDPSYKYLGISTSSKLFREKQSEKVNLAFADVLGIADDELILMEDKSFQETWSRIFEPRYCGDYDLERDRKIPEAIEIAKEYDLLNDLLAFIPRVSQLEVEVITSPASNRSYQQECSFKYWGWRGDGWRKIIQAYGDLFEAEIEDFELKPYQDLFAQIDSNIATRVKIYHKDLLDRAIDKAKHTYDSNYTKDELLGVAEDLGVEVRKSWKKSKIIDAFKIDLEAAKKLLDIPDKPDLTPRKDYL